MKWSDDEWFKINGKADVDKTMSFKSFFTGIKQNKEEKFLNLIIIYIVSRKRECTRTSNSPTATVTGSAVQSSRSTYSRRRIDERSSKLHGFVIIQVPNIETINKISFVISEFVDYK